PAREQDRVVVRARVERLGDTDAKARQLAAIVLSVLGPRAEPAVTGLTAAVKDSDPRVRGSALSALAAIGPAARAAVPAILEALKDENGDVRRSAEAALQTIDPDAARKGPRRGTGFTGQRPRKNR